MQRLLVDGINFDFPADWHVSKYDDWSFYRNRFTRMWSGITSLDLLAIGPEKTAWLIEVKDYRIHQRTKPIDIAHEVAHKVFDTLAALLPTKVNADDATEKSIACEITKAKRLRVILHLEQPAKHSKLFPRAINPANVRQKLCQLLRPIDAHPVVAESTRMGTLEWRVS
jgi:hypothetical protein